MTQLFCIGAVVALAAGPATGVSTTGGTIHITTEHLRIAIGGDGKCRDFVDRRTEKNYCVTPALPLTRIKLPNAIQGATAARLAGEQLVLGFGLTGVQVTLRPLVHGEWLTLEVAGVAGPPVQELTLCDIPLSLAGSLEEPFSGCALALNLETNVPEIPGPNPRLRAFAQARFGLVGAKVAIIGAPTGKLRTILQQAVRAAPDLPHSPIGGPWALDAPINRGSYLFNFADLSETTVDDWIRLANGLGMNQIDFHGGNSFRFGDCQLNEKTYPRGRASMKAVIDRLHAAGIQAGLHTYAFFIDKRCPWVTPVPDPRLAKDAALSLAQPLTADATTIVVNEPTAKMSAVTGFFVRNSATLQIGNELITYTGVKPDAPFAFTGCQRGALGTKAAAHAAGEKVHHLKECFGLFVPDPDSTLFGEVAAKTAETFNECGFDIMYLDALDGEDILGGAENGWHYGSKFVFEIWKRLERPALMEMSTFHHHLWYVRSRIGAWDHPTRGHKKFIDLHCAANDQGQKSFLPGHLGWWAIASWTGPHREPTFADDIEYLCTKALARDTGFSLMGVDPQSYARNANLRRLGEITQRYEALRRSGRVSEKTKNKLRPAGTEFTLGSTADGRPVFRPAQHIRHKVESAEPWTSTWKVRNQFERQPLVLRIEALMTAGPYDPPGNITLAEFRTLGEFAPVAAAAGIVADLKPTGQRVKAGGTSGRFTAANPHSQRAGTWVHAQKAFQPTVNLAGHQALGVWVHGDGQGEVLNFQLRSPAHLVSGIGEHYVIVDFTGWRYFQLIEPEGERYSDFSWPYGSPYGIYRETVHHAQVSSLGLWYNHLPAAGKVACDISPVRALPLVKARLQDPTISVNGRRLAFPVVMESGSYLELRPDCTAALFGPDGTKLQTVQPKGEPVTVESGENEITFAATELGGHAPRARVTLTTLGPPLAE